MSIVVEQADRADITEAIAHHNATLKRMPAHWTERRANVHRAINALLDDLELLGWDDDREILKP